MSSRRALLAQNRNLEINTIIGGIASVITTREQLATRLQIGQRRIRNFTIVGNDIHCTMMQIYHIPANCFENDTNITDYIDLGDKLRGVGISAFQNSTLINFYAPYAIISNSGLQCNFTNVDFSYEYLNLRENAFSSTSALRNSRFKKLNAPNIVELNNDSVRDNTELLEVYTPKLEIVNLDALNGCVSLNTMTTENIESIISRAFRETAFTDLSFPKLITIGGVSPFRYITELVKFYAPILEEISSNPASYFFNNWTSITLIDTRKLKVFGTPSEQYTAAFANSKLGFKWMVNIAMATNNSGGVDASVLYAKDTKGATIEFYDDNGDLVSTL